jgi:hypothetical protein
MLTTKLLQCLSATVDACEEFCNSHLVYFHGDRPLRAIEMTFIELAGLKKRLKSLAERCVAFAEEVGPNTSTFIIHLTIYLRMNINIYIH